MAVKTYVFVLSSGKSLTLVLPIVPATLSKTVEEFAKELFSELFLEVSKQLASSNNEFAQVIITLMNNNSVIFEKYLCVFKDNHEDHQIRKKIWEIIKIFSEKLYANVVSANEFQKIQTKEEK